MRFQIPTSHTGIKSHRIRVHAIHYNELWESRSQSENPGVSSGIQIWKVGHSSIYIYSLLLFQIIREFFFSADILTDIRYLTDTERAKELEKRKWTYGRLNLLSDCMEHLSVWLSPTETKPESRSVKPALLETLPPHLGIAFASFSGQHYPPENYLVLSPLSGSHILLPAG